MSKVYRRSGNSRQDFNIARAIRGIEENVVQPEFAQGKFLELTFAGSQDAEARHYVSNPRGAILVNNSDITANRDIVWKVDDTSLYAHTTSASSATFTFYIIAGE